MRHFSHNQRQTFWDQLDKEEYDLLIVGGGITGAGTARDAASRGMKVALIESSDFASGTSSRSSKLIHGGIRYLENKEFKLVFEALNERTRLFEIAPHLVHPLRFMIPLYENSRVGMFKMGLGMWLYDALALFQAPEMHERLNAEQSFSRMKMLKPEQLVGSFVYSDAYMDDDRLVHETLRSANEYGVHSLNYVKAKSIEIAPSGKIQSLTAHDILTGKEKKIRARHFVGSVGPWTDLLGESFFHQWKKVLRPTKGIHITVSKDRLPLSSAVVMAAEKSDRIVFGIPRHEMVIVGTTDTDFKGDPSQVVAEPDDVKYLLEIVGHYFPGAQLKKEDIIATYAGVRPLVNDGASTEGKTSREHVIWNHENHNITFVAGGKYTTYRLMATQVVERVLRFFPIEERAKFANSQTKKPLISEATVDLLNQSLNSIPKIAAENFRSEAEVTSLCQRYAMEAQSILARNPKHYTYWQLEAAQAIDFTMCLNLVDFYARRVPLFLARADHGLPFVKEIGAVFQEKLGWSEQKLDEQIQLLHSYMQRELSWQSRM
jgi:glycerol-3-phosphate dehydrogenase